MPIASQRQFILLAVNIPEHEPHPGQAEHSISDNSSSLIFPALTAPTASNTVLRSLPSNESMGPPETKTDGKLHLAAAISIPGTTLSQLGMKTSASKQWAFTIHSILSAINSREARL